MSDSGDLFNFVPRNDPTPSHRNAAVDNRHDSSRKRPKNNTALYSFMKKPTRRGGLKIIRIEIYDADKIENAVEHSMCKCDAELCVQHVVKNILLDDVYKGTRDVINKIEESLASDSYNGYTL
uniref:Uncharacterized protein n=1 Tax=Pectinophora gossypiella TaxID=13191 RepID=A0A1E1VYT9_PECGO